MGETLMKKTIALLICLMLVLSTMGCGLLPFLALKGLEKNDEEQQIEHVEELEEANEAFLSFMEEEFILDRLIPKIIQTLERV